MFTSWKHIPGQQRSPSRVLKLISTDKVSIGQVSHQGPSFHEHHSHQDFEQITIVIEGRMTFSCGDEERVLGPGDIVYVPAGTPHGVSVRKGDHAVTLEIFSPSRTDLPDVKLQ